MKRSVIIVDDEPMSRGFIQRYCEKLGYLEVVGSFEDAQSALTYLHTHEIDIIFLDVEMPNLSGFQLLDQMMYMPKVILTTAKIDYAFDAFEARHHRASVGEREGSRLRRQGPHGRRV